MTLAQVQAALQAYEAGDIDAGKRLVEAAAEQDARRAQLLDDAADKLSRAGYEETAAELRELLHQVEEDGELRRAEHLSAGPDPRRGR